MSDVVIELDGREIALSHPDKVLFPDDGITKRDLADYYRRIAPAALPHWRERALSMERFPDGIEAEGFFQKQIPDHFPDWIDRARLAKEGGTITHVVANDAATMVYLADQGCITPHLALARVATPERPDRLIFDLDPSDDRFDKVQDVAARLRDALDDRGLASFVQTSGSRGLHIVLPLDASAGFDATRGFARRLAEEVARAAPALATTAQRKAARGDRVFIDYLRNGYGQTSVAPYAVRARPGAPVATPLRWREAGAADLTPRAYTIANIFRRLGQTDDPWAGIDAAANRAADLAR
ncbi:ATP-dependent DNA ligase [Rhodobacteraceae bacterium WD3A24]|nr:ATP-dependent DNA ligase [Rhodobacteraceae bacterium WD3A24]